MNPYEPQETDATQDRSDESTDDLGFLARLAIHGLLVALNILFYAFVALLYWFGGTAAIIAVFVGIPVAILLTFLLLYWMLVPTPEQRREYLRDKRRKIRAARENGGYPSRAPKDGLRDYSNGCSTVRPR